MAQKVKSLFVCSACGNESAKWYGCCPGCGEWNTMQEQQRMQINTARREGASGGVCTLPLTLDAIQADGEIRYGTGMTELDRVLGGGLVKGSVVLLSGDPGIGKSTILLQICEHMGKNIPILYVSGEESAHQIKLRADRLGVKTQQLSILCETDTQSVCEIIRTNRPGLVFIDSIQTMAIGELTSSAGSVTQVRESTAVFMRMAKNLGIPIIVVGHVNKDGNIAGPKVLEHVVDAVLYFEGERHLSYRILRAVKNRFGSTNEIGVFEMGDRGLTQVSNPSQMLISGRAKDTSGSCVACVMEGSRPLLAEVQGLVTPTGFGTPRRMATGFDYNRMSMLIAVLEKRAGYFFGNMDAYLNIAGGLKLDEPAIDLPVALALVSSLKDVPVMEDGIAFGEIGLGGEIRAVSNCETRIREAERLGFRRCLIPRHNYAALRGKKYEGLEILPVRNVVEAFAGIVKRDSSSGGSLKNL